MTLKRSEKPRQLRRRFARLVEGCMRVNAICLAAGHYRVEEGGEHYLFYELEERLQRLFIHGWTVGLGVHLLIRLQENRHAKALALLIAVAVYHPFAWAG